MSPEPRVLHDANHITPAWLEQILGQAVRHVERVEAAGTWSVHVRLRVHLAGEETPRRLRVKLGSATTFGRGEVDYYRRYFTALEDAPLLRCYHAAADVTHYHLLLEDVAETHRDQFEVPPTELYGRKLVEAMARLHAHCWPRPAPDADALERALASARAGLPRLIDAMAAGFTAADRDAVREQFDWHPDALRARLALPTGFTWLHGDLNPGNVLAPIAGEGPFYLIDHQPFVECPLPHWLGVYDLAYAIGVWWPAEARRAWERPLVAHWHAQLEARGVTGYPLAQAWDDWRLALLQGLYVPAARCSEPGAVDSMRWVWEPQLRRALAAMADHA